jgi:hypothetical protein
MPEAQTNFDEVIMRLSFNEVRHIQVTRDLADLGTEAFYAAGKIVSYGRNRSKSGTITTWVAMGNDTSAHPTIVWEESRYYTVKVL